MHCIRVKNQTGGCLLKHFDIKSNIDLLEKCVCTGKESMPHERCQYENLSFHIETMPDKFNIVYENKRVKVGKY